MIKCFPWDLNHKFVITLKLYGVRFAIIGHFGVKLFNNDGLGFPLQEFLVLVVQH
jgi:hypothetical protein